MKCLRFEEKNMYKNQKNMINWDINAFDVEHGLY